MRILHVTPSYFPAVRYGGPIWSVHHLAIEQIKLGHDVEVYTTNIDGDSVSNVPVGRKIEVDGVSVTYFSVGFFRRTMRAPSMAVALKQNISSFDVVHNHSVFLWPTYISAREARLAKVPYVISPRGMLWAELIRQRSRVMKKLWIAIIEKKNLKYSAAVHVTSDIEGRKIMELGLPMPRTINLPNGVDIPRNLYEGEISEDISREIKRGEFLLSFGRLNWKKNNVQLIKAMLKLPNVRLIVAGNQEDEHCLELRSIIKKYDLTERVSVISRQVSGRDKELLFSSAVMFVLPSLSENFGNTVLEAMVRGVAVVVSKEAGAAEVVKKIGCGLVCSPNSASLADSIKVLLENKSDMRAMAELGKEAAIGTYSWSAVSRSMVEEYGAL